MKRNRWGICRFFLLLSLTCIGFAFQAVAQETSQTPAKYVVHDLVFRVMDLAGRVTDLQGKETAMAAKIQNMQVKETGAEIRIELAADVLFDFDKADILPKAQTALKQVASIIREKAKGKVRIEGHTDSKGSDAYNQKLSEQRAQAVKTWLSDKEGVQSVDFETQGFGAKKPVVPNKKPDGSDDPEGRQKNRRVEIILKK